MRSFEERKAEVLRRSEKKIQERKRRNSRISAMCIPFFLAAVVWAASLPANHKNLYDKEGVKTEDSGDTYEANQKSSIGFTSEYIRTDIYCEGIPYPVVKVIRSVEELNAYYNSNKNVYDAAHEGEEYSDTAAGFEDIFKRYDETYFQKQMLVMVVLEEGSGSIRHNVDRVELGEDGKLYISISSIVPEIATDDMAWWHVLIEPERGVNVASESDVIVYLDGVNPKTQPTVVKEWGDYHSNIALTIPYDWKYEVERREDSNDYCISFWPADQTEGKIKMWYFDVFGVCGTGLKQEEITVGAYTAHKGTYYDDKMWYFIRFANTPGYYVAINDGAEKWWDQYGEEAMQILSTIQIAEGIITETQAIEIAKKDVTVEYNQIYAEFDSQDGLWTVRFSKENAAGGDQVITMTHEGKIIDIEYGE